MNELEEFLRYILMGQLKMASGFRNDNKDIRIEYRLDADYSELIEKYRLYEVTGTGTDFDKAKRLLNWVSDNNYHYGMYNAGIKNTAMDLLAYSFNRGEEYGINCRSLSMILTECLLAVGVKARVMYIFPCSPYDFDNHVVCEAYISELNKWVMLDPTYNLYATDNGTPLGIMEIRALLADKKKFDINEEFNYNGQPYAAADIYDYYTKDMYRFSVCSIQGTNSEVLSESVMINIVPEGYDVQQADVANWDFRVSMLGGADDEYRKRLENAAKTYAGVQVLE